MAAIFERVADQHDGDGKQIGAKPCLAEALKRDVLRFA
jgi:hypothetical protein